MRGAIRIGEADAPQFNLIELSDGGDSVEIEALEDSVLLLGHGEPIREPLVAHGPFVVNTNEEIHAAIRDYQSGRFGT